MDRRNFIKTGAAAVAAAAVAGGFPATVYATPAAAAPTVDGYPGGIDPTRDRIQVRFLGTGAADWNGPDPKTGEYRRLSSVLLCGKTLIDFTPSAKDMLPEGCAPEAIFYTHSHGDHFNPAAALDLGLSRVYLSETWIDRARKKFREASEKTGFPVPEIIPIKVGEKYLEDGLVFTPLPANHATSDLHEQALIYLVESTDARLLYATDTGGIMALAAQHAGIDAHRNGKPITGLIMEATMGVDHTDDYRIYTHSSVDTVARTYRVLKSTRRYVPRMGQKVYITHMAKTLHGTHEQIAKAVPSPLCPAYDGLEVEF